MMGGVCGTGGAREVPVWTLGAARLHLFAHHLEALEMSSRIWTMTPSQKLNILLL